jgi:hypothetical protein
MNSAPRVISAGKGVTMCQSALVRDVLFLTRTATQAVVISAVFGAYYSFAQIPAIESGTPPSSPASKPTEASPDQAALEKAFVEMLSGATLEGSFTSTGAGRDPTKLAREKYTITDVRKLHGNLWSILARIQYGEHDVTLPIIVPIKWAGDTPVIVVDNIPLPGFGAVSARVMFFADHYAGYWKHGDHGGHLFGIISREQKPEK